MTEELRAKYLELVASKRDDADLARVAAAEERALAERDAADMAVESWAFEAELPERAR